MRFSGSAGVWPALVFLLLVLVVPVGQLLGLSITDESGHLSLAAFGRLFETTLYIKVLFNTFNLALWSTVVCLIGGYPVAYLLAAGPMSFRRIMLIGVMVPFWTSVLVRTFAWLIILGRHGALNQFFAQLGIADSRPDLIYNFTGVLIGLTQAMMPLAILTMSAVMQQTERDIQYAAATLGARGAHVFWRIFFPLSLPGVSAAGLLVFITALGFFVTPVFMGSPRETMIAQLIVVQIDEMLDWGFAGAIAVLLLATSLIVFYIVDKVLGIAALAGETRERSENGPGPFGRASGRVGLKIVAALGWVFAFLGQKLDHVLKRRSGMTIGSPSLGTCLIALFVIFFLAAPCLVLVPISFSEGSTFDWPPSGFSLQWYQAIANSPLWREAILRSIWVGLWTALLAIVLGTPAAFALTRHQIAGKPIIIGTLLLPLVMPHIIVALALFYAFSKVGLLGSSFGLILGHTIFALPYAVVTMMAVLRGYDQRLDQAAWGLGAGRMATFWWITFPLIKTGMATAFVFSFVKSFDELTVALFISGGTSTTLPKQMWAESVLNISPVLAAVSTLIIAGAICVTIFGLFVGQKFTSAEGGK